jgi:hypothetical protein
VVKNGVARWGARRDSLGFVSGGFVKAARDRVPPLGVPGVALQVHTSGLRS